MLVDIPPRLDGTVSRNGVGIHYQVFGEGAETILLLPTWTIIHSDFWRLQVPYFSRRYTVVAFDARGNGASDRPVDPQAYADAEGAEDAAAVLDAVGVRRAAIISVSAGANWAALLAANHSDRVAGAVFIGSSLPVAPNSPARTAAIATFDESRTSHEGWGKWNRHYWHQDWWGFLEFFMHRCFTEPDSESYVRHFVEMGLQTTPEIVAATIDAPSLDMDEARRVASAIACPVLVIHGDSDAIAPLENGIELARLTRAGLHVLPGAGHEPELRQADHTNQLIELFLERTWPTRV